MKIKIVYRNKDLEIAGVDEFSFEEYCDLLSQKTLSLLYQIDDLMNGNIEYYDIKKYIFNLAGSIQRMPQNIVEDDKPKKWFDILGRGK